MNSDSEWYTLCSKNNTLLEHLEDTNDFKITFDVLEKYENIVEIIQDNKLFELLFELNKDVIINYSETINKNTSNVTLTISSKNLPSIDDKFTEANQGKAFYTGLSGLGEMIFQDYEANRKKKLK